MERNVIHVRPEQTVEQCMALMTDKRVRHLPVLEGNKVTGIVSTAICSRVLFLNKNSLLMNTTFTASAVQANNNQLRMHSKISSGLMSSRGHSILSSRGSVVRSARIALVYRPSGVRVAAGAFLHAWGVAQTAPARQ
jgi:CBS domain-containing protein